MISTKHISRHNGAEDDPAAQRPGDSSPPCDPGLEALIREARRRQRRRYLVAGLAAVLASAGLAGGAAALRATTGSDQSGPRPPRGTAVRHGAPGPAAQSQPGPIPASVNSSVVMWPVGPEQTGAIDIDNLRARSVRQSPASGIDPGEYQPIMLVGHRVVYAASAGVMSAPLLGSGRPRRLGKVYYFAPSAVPGQVWLQSGSTGRGPDVVRPVNVTGGQTGAPVTLPAGATLLAGTDAGLLLRSRSGGLQLWEPGSAPRGLPYYPRTDGLLAVSPLLVAYETGCRGTSTSSNFGFSVCRVLQAYNVVTGRVRMFAAPAGTTGWIPFRGQGGGLSLSDIAASGRLMAAQAAISPDDQGMARVFVLHLAGPARPPQAVPSSAAFLLSVTAWSPDGSWLFYQGPGLHLWAYQPATGRVRASRTPCCQYQVLAAIANRRN